MLARDTGPLLPFATMKEARALKAELKRLTASDDAYYLVLARFDMEHFNTSPTCAAWKEPKQLRVKVLDALRMEVNVHAWSAGTPNEPPKMFIAFTGHAEIEELRQAIKMYSDGDESFYTKTLLKHGCTNASEITDSKVGIKIHRALALERNRLREEAGLMAILKMASDKLDARLFAKVLERHACKTIGDVLELMADPLGALLTELKFWSDQKS